MIYSPRAPRLRVQNSSSDSSRWTQSRRFTRRRGERGEQCLQPKLPFPRAPRLRVLVFVRLAALDAESAEVLETIRGLL